MVDLTLEAIDLESKCSSKDMYVAVRVGEVQKLSKVSASRAYKFTKSAIGERRFGKVDLFKRVGSASIGIKPDTDATQEIRINVDADSWGFRVLVGGTEAEVDKSAQKNISPKVNEAKAYLLEHNLEMRLSEAMQAVLREKPSDPAAFIAESLAKNAGQLTRPAPPSQAPAPAPATSTEQLCKKAKDALVAASADGRLDAELSNMTPCEAAPKGDGIEELRTKAKETLIGASSDGKLDAVLASLQQPKASSTGRTPAEVDELRLKAKATLMGASSDGKLDAILADLKGSNAEKPNKADELRKKAKATLMAGSDNGKLDSVLADLKAPKAKVLEEPICTKGPQPAEADPTTNELETLRAQAKEILVGASSNGKLDEILKDLHPLAQAAAATSETEALRMQAKQALLDASLDGRLQKTLQEGLIAGEGQTLDKLREQAKSTLLEASMNGQLEATLQAAIAETNEDATAASRPPLHMMPLQNLYGPGFPTFHVAPGFILR